MQTSRRKLIIVDICGSERYFNTALFLIKQRFLILFQLKTLLIREDERYYNWRASYPKLFLRYYSDTD